jgi:hypothetical protein
MIIAVDGPAASGKGTIARALAKHYGLPHLDTGLLYRAVAATVRNMHLDPTREADAVAACSFDDSLLADPAATTRRASSPRSSRRIRWSGPRCSSGKSVSRSNPAARSSTDATSAR